MKKVIIVLFMSVSLLVTAQNVGIGTSTPDPSAKLDVVDTARGILIPRMSAIQRLAITLPATSLLVFDTDSASFMYFDSTWKKLGGISVSTINGNQMIAGAVGLGGKLVKNTNIDQDTFDFVLTRQQQMFGVKVVSLFINGRYKTPFVFDTLMTNAHIVEATSGSQKIFEVSGITGYSPNFDSSVVPMPIQAVYAEDTATGRKELNIVGFAEGVYIQAIIADSGDLSHPTESSIFSVRGAHSYSSHTDRVANNLFEMESSASAGLSLSSGTPDSIISRYQLPLMDGTPGQLMKTNGVGQLGWVTPQPIEEKIIFETRDNDTVFFSDSLFDFSLSDTGASTHLVVMPKVAAALGQWSLGEGTSLNFSSLIPEVVAEELNLMSSKMDFQMDKIDGPSVTYQFSIHHLNSVRGASPDKWVVLMKVIP